MESRKLPAQESAPQPGKTPEIAVQARQNMGRGVTKALLSNGVTILVRQNHAAPLVTVRCFVRNTGSAFEGRYLGTGISHMLEHMAAGGTTTGRPEAESKKLFDKMGGLMNAFTTTDVTAFYVDCPVQFASTAIELLADNMQNSTIPESEFRREMGVVQRELEMGEADRDRVLHHAMKSLLYLDHPIRHPTIGYLPVVQQVTREDVVSYYKGRYVPQNLVFVVVGDVDTNEIVNLVLSQFKNSPRTTERGAVFAEEPPQSTPRSNRLEMEGDTTNFCVAWPTVSLQHPDMYALDVASYLLAHGDSSRIAYRLKIEKPLAVSADSTSYTPGFTRGWLDVTVQCSPKNLDECIRIVEEEIAELKSKPVAPAELERVKRQKSAEHVFAQQTIQDQANALGMSYISTGDPLYDEQYVAGINSVTAAQVQAVANRYLLADRTNMVIIDPIGQKRKSEEVEATPVESPVVRQQLPNGLTVLLKRHAVTPTVSIQVFTNGGVLADTPETSGRSALACELLTRGTEKFSGREIAEYFDSIGGTFSVSSQRNTSILQCNVLRDDWENSLEYIEQVLFQPKFTEDEFQKIRTQQVARIAARKADPQTEILDFWTAQLPKSSPYSRTILGNEQTLAKLSADACREFHKRAFVPASMVLTVYGDIDPDAAFVTIEKRFGQIPKADARIPKVPDRHEGPGKSAHLTSMKENTAMVLVSYPSVNVKNTKQRAALDVLNALLTGGGGAGGRLFEELRGQQLVYYVFGVEITGPAPGFFVLMAQTRPESMAEVSQRIQVAVRKVGTEGVPAPELELTKEKLLSAYAVRNATPTAQAFQAGIDELYGLGYDHDEKYAERIRSVTLADLKKLVTDVLQKPIVITSAPGKGK